MTTDEFLKTYHDYQTYDEDAALAEARKVNEQATGFKVVVVDFDTLGYCLMLQQATKGMGFSVIEPM